MMPSMFGNIGQAAGGMFGRLNPYADTMMMAGMGLLSGNDWQSGMGNAMQGVMAGRGMDNERLDRKKTSKAEEARRVAIDRLMQSGQLGNLSPEMQGVMGTNPDLATSVVSKRLTPEDDNWQKLDENTLYRSRSGETRDVGAEPGPDAASIANITSIRKEIDAKPGTSRFRSSVPILTSMSAAVDDTTAMADLDFIYGMAQIFDPDSVVRETEMGMVIDSQSMPAALKGRLEKVLNGQATLGPQARKDLVSAAGRRVGEYRSQAEMEAAQFEGIADRNRIPRADIMRPLEPMPQFQQQQAAPQNDIFDDPATIPEGATVEDEQGRRFRKVNGQLVPVT